ncbi:MULTISPECIES: molybdopterin synthase sulfur carrier subunit [Vibrio]|uniref:molybdopterin synthase sulfur carrier subunit n=1 Tax=Vibrio TaxID=662 RepID=UPI000C16E7E0|nr:MULTISPECIES: molybdopterin synthase sulfur carrier subunit [Vibrio]NAW69500.1 molybdopterin synthase sulfur carrier subunit [Vibrio sp. V28_P6S34P95]NAX06239.1 molybdopterin synthase sulfur carrier subunit [Vibrio sp. V30_P3S12P165]NAX35445.1 molybdopterin synthase sulfur carrier subunit [Vibrio sp. V29_P1S30P107]NAX38966.1 molybdopterin synthase sulfur carrier subunit [Vibrio sp. V27_P1S3P104]NAX39989.1 molybdopterin synthase sulfur carrier subunit [Vibrio sp. V26_P1S5P106]
MIKVLFFAQTRELLGCDQIELEARFETVEALRHYLSQQEGKWPLALQADKLLAAVNQSIVPMMHPLQSGDEVAFFPPVTGG